MEGSENKKRTESQNRALHLYFQMVSEALNDAGLSMRVVLAPEVEIQWSKESVKEYLWKPVQKIQLQKKSTTELDTKDIDIIYDTVNSFLATRGLHIKFPSIEEIIFKQLTP